MIHSTNLRYIPDPEGDEELAKAPAVAGLALTQLARMKQQMAHQQLPQGAWAKVYPGGIRIETRSCFGVDIVRVFVPPTPRPLPPLPENEPIILVERIPWETWDLGMRGMHDWIMYLDDWPGTEQTDPVSGYPQPIDYYNRRIYIPEIYGGEIYNEAENGVVHYYVPTNFDETPAHIVTNSDFVFRPQRGLSAERKLTTEDHPWGAGDGELSLIWRASDGDPAIDPALLPYCKLDFSRIILQPNVFTSWEYFATDPPFFGLKVYLAEAVQFYDSDGVLADFGNYRDWDFPEGARWVEFTLFDDWSVLRFESSTDYFGSPLIYSFKHPDRNFILPGTPRYEEPDGARIPYSPYQNWRELFGPVYSDFAAENSRYGYPYVWPEAANQQLKFIRANRNSYVGSFETTFDMRHYIDWPVGAIVIYSHATMGVHNLSWALDTIDFSETIIECTGLSPAQEAMIVTHNEHRAAIELVPFRCAQELVVAARRHARDMAANRLYDHYGSDGSDPMLRILEAGYYTEADSYWSVAENTAFSAVGTPVADFFALWLGSPSHRATIEEPKYQDIGVATAVGEDGTQFWVACFGVVGG